jgi:sedoheptulose-bisphosphatase
VNQLMVKGKGVFVNVASSKTKSKLRILYEVAPLAYLIEKAGGVASNGEISPLDVLIKCTEQTSQVAYGSRKEVERFEELVGVKYVPVLEEVLDV